MECIRVQGEKKYIKEFLILPRLLYSQKQNMESSSSVKELLLKEHALSGYFDLDAYIIRDKAKTVGRFAITTYKGDDTAYLGFFECIDSKEAAAFLFEKAREISREKKCKRILGPVDASFWIKYRLKINLFELPPYTGEPYNKDYYYKLFLDNGFAVKEHYTSSGYKAIDESYVNEKFESRYKEFLAKGYRIESPKIEDYDKAMGDVYTMISELYSDFPVFKALSREDFAKTFSSYKSIMNMSMTKIAYYEDKAVGFYISLPDYGNKVYHLNFFNLFKILKIKKQPKQYVMLYMGVDAKHRGLGKAIVYAIMKELEENGLPSIGALARDGKVTQNYAAEVKDRIYEYVLLGLDL